MLEDYLLEDYLLVWNGKERFHIAHLNLALAYLETGDIFKLVEHTEYALENNHKTIARSVK